MSEKIWRKVSETVYEIIINNETKRVFCPFAKVQKIFTDYIMQGGQISEEGEASVSDALGIRIMVGIANTVLTEYGPEGDIVKEGNCAMLAPSEIKGLIEIGKDCIQNFSEMLNSVGDESDSQSQKDGKSPKKTKNQ